MRRAMKIQLVVLNSLGEFKSEIKEVSEKLYADLTLLCQEPKDFFSFIDENGQEIFFQEELIANSLIKIVKME